MIQANELRIGNQVLNDGCIVTVKSITDYLRVITKEGNEITAHLDLVEPIPLTPELLERAGFLPVKDRKGIYRTIDEQYQISFFEGINAVFYIKYDDFRGYCYLNGLLFDLHQLQNLYFCLTGGELTL